MDRSGGQRMTDVRSRSKKGGTTSRKKKPGKVEEGIFDELYDSLFGGTWDVWVGAVILSILSIFLFIIASPWGSSGGLLILSMNMFEWAGMSFSESAPDGVRDFSGHRYAMLSLIIFFGAGIIGGLLYYVMSLTEFASMCTTISGAEIACPALGASGAVYGLLGAVAVMLPNMRIFVFFMPMPMRYAAILWFGISFFGTFTDDGTNIGHAAHLGGLLFGLVYAWFLNRKGHQETYYIPPERWE